MTHLKSLRPRLGTLDSRTAKPAPGTWENRKATEPFMTFYASAEWQRFRAEVIAERGKRCEAPGCGATPGRVYLDHVKELKDGGAGLDRSNVMVLCASCHTRKTAQARMARYCAPC